MTANNQQEQDIVNIAADKESALKQAIFKYLSYWYWFALALIISYTCAYLYLRYSTPIYSASAKVLIKNEKSGGVSQQDILSDLNLFNTKTNVGDELEILKTSYVMKEVVKELELNVSYFSVGNIKSLEYYKTAPFYAHIFLITDSTPGQQYHIKFKENSFHLQGGGFDKNYSYTDTVKSERLAFLIEKKADRIPPDDEFILNIGTVDGTANAYTGSLSAEFINKTSNVIRISISTTVPQKGVDILNKLYEVYNRLNKKDKNLIADSTISFINNRLGIVSEELAGVEKNVEDFKRNNKLSVDMSQQAGIVLSSMSEIDKELIQQDVEINVVEYIENHIKSNGYRVVPSALVITDPSYLALVEKYNSLVLERDNQLETSREDNPLIKNYNQQIENVRKDLLTSLANVKQGMQIAKDALLRKNSALSSQLSTGPSTERAFNDIARQQEVKQQLYLYLLQKREETAVSKSGIISNSRLIEPAKSGGPVSPDRNNIFMIALLAGLGVPFAFIYLLNFLNNRVTERRDITSITNAPIIGELGHNSTNENIIVKSGSRSTLAEQFRAIRTNLQFILKGREQQVIMLTSSMSGEGKSFLSLNLAAFLALSGKRTVIVELDLRKPKIATLLNLQNTKGFSNYMISEIKVEDLPVKTDIHPNLYIVSSGPVPPNPAELLLQEKAESFFAYLKTSFDFIILDTPPVGLVTDAVYLRGSNTEDKTSSAAININLSIKNADNTVLLADGVVVRFAPGYHKSVTIEDARKAYNFAENLAIGVDTSRLISERRPLPGKGDTIFLKLWGTGVKNYQFAIHTSGIHLPAGVKASLVDKYLNTKTPISLNGNITTVDFSVGTDSASKSIDRFYIVAPGNGVDIIAGNNSGDETVNGTGLITMKAFPNPVVGNDITVTAGNLAKANYEIGIYTAAGVKMLTRTIEHSGGMLVEKIRLASWSNGAYNIQLTDGNGNKIKTVAIVISR